MKKRIYLSMCSLAGLIIICITVLISSIFHRVISEEMMKETKREAEYVAKACNDIGDDLAYFNSLDNGTLTRITLIDEEGQVLYDSNADAEVMENHLSRPEVKSAFENGSGYSVRTSGTLVERTFYYAIRLESGIVVRLSRTVDSIYYTFYQAIPVITSVALIILFITLIIANKIAKFIIKPIDNLDLKNPSNMFAYDELQPLFKKINKQNKQLEQHVNELKEQQENFIAVTNNMSEGLVILDKHSTIMSLNDSCKRLLEARDLAYIGKNILQLTRNLEILEAIDHSLEGNTYSNTIEINYRHLQILSNPVEEAGENCGVVLLILDVTEKQTSERVRKEFTANVSHELKTPLTSISGYAELMQNNLVKSEDIPDFSRKIYDEARRLIDLVNDIIKLSRLDEMESGNNIRDDRVETKVDIQLNDFISSIVERLKMVAAIAGVDLTEEFTEEHIHIISNPGMLDELISNLIENAIKYNKISGTVRISAVYSCEHILIQVQDTGIGIADKDKQRIFERFYRVDKSHSKQTGGTGLGLAIVKHIVEYHNGFIELDSQLGQGTIIRVYLKNL